jgi:hypothetical protein
MRQHAEAAGESLKRRDAIINDLKAQLVSLSIIRCISRRP